MGIVNILAISGSLRNRSSNTALLHAAAELANGIMDVAFYNGIEDLPHFNPDSNGDAPPVSVQHFRTALRQADGVLISTPEYAGGVPGVLKNALDWLVSSAELYEKPVAVISASPSPRGGEKAYESLMLTLGLMNAKITDGLKIAYVSGKINADGKLKDSETIQAMRSLLSALAKAAERSSE